MVATCQCYLGSMLFGREFRKCWRLSTSYQVSTSFKTCFFLAVSHYCPPGLIVCILLIKCKVAWWVFNLQSKDSTQTKVFVLIRRCALEFPENLVGHECLACLKKPSIRWLVLRNWPYELEFCSAGAWFSVSMIALDCQDLWTSQGKTASWEWLQMARQIHWQVPWVHCLTVWQTYGKA